MPFSALCIGLGALLAQGAAPEEVVLFDFTQGLHGWSGNPRVTSFEATPEGMAFECAGVDPWLEGPVAPAFPLGDKVIVTVRMKSTGSGSIELFYGETGFDGGRMRQAVGQHDGTWQEYEMLLPAQTAPVRLRIDPLAGDGSGVVAWIKARPLRPAVKVELQKASPVTAPLEHTLASGAVEIAHGAQWDQFAVRVDGQEMAQSPSAGRIGFVVDGSPVWIEPAAMDTTVETTGDALTVTATAADPGGARWTLTRAFTPGPEGSVDVVTTVGVDQDREVAHLPWISLFPGLGTYGGGKTQALLPGVEYLSDEPSSSEADLEGEQAIRRITDPYRICYPMMTVVAEGRYIGLMWNRADNPAPVFDSPDRMHHSGAHLMALWSPGVGKDRLENDIDPMGTMTLEANKPLSLSATIIGGEGTSVVPAVQHYIALRPLPPVPEFEGGFKDAVPLLAAGWLDSDANQGGLHRHAVWGDFFPPGPSSDAAVYMRWLAGQTDDQALAKRLIEGAALSEKKVVEMSPHPMAHHTAHIDRPLPLLTLAHPLMPEIERRVAMARQLLGEFGDDGLRVYKPRPDGPDYGRTHYENHANGHSAQALIKVFEAATLSGDEALARDALEVLEKMTKVYRDTVPRGAQTWEMPLHTPDIMGSAHMIHCMVAAYHLTGDPKWIEEARYWAWTGVTMIYLDQPVEGDVGLYATIAVIGATGWKAPNWIGQPVQWCGLVYRTALEELALVDEAEADTWRTLATGITRSGMQMTFPLDDEERQGLLPDYFLLKPQVSDGPAISPGTVQFNLPEAYDRDPMYRMARVTPGGLILHAPGPFEAAFDTSTLTVELKPWPQGPCRVIVARMAQAPSEVLWNGTPAATEHSEELGVLAVTIEGPGTLELTGVK